MWQYKYSDELYHWKYIKKKKVNGKWRYYYDYKDALGYDEKRNLQIANLNAANAQKERDKWVTLDQRNTDRITANAKARSTDGKTVYTENEKASVSIMNDAVWESYKKFLDAERKVKEAEDKYKETPLYKLSVLKSTIDRGMKAVNSFINGIVKDVKVKTTNNNGTVNEIKIKEIKIKENVIKENVIKENVIKENVIKENVIKEKKYY